MKHQRFKLIIFCSNDNPVLILTYFTARSNFATSAFIWENVTMMDTMYLLHPVTWNLVYYVNKMIK